MSASDAYKRAFHCGVGGHDGHPGDDFGNLTNEADQVYDDRCALAVEWSTLRSALRTIANIANGDMALAQDIARKALGEL